MPQTPTASDSASATATADRTEELAVVTAGRTVHTVPRMTATMDMEARTNTQNANSAFTENSTSGPQPSAPTIPSDGQPVAPPRINHTPAPEYNASYNDPILERGPFASSPAPSYTRCVRAGHVITAATAPRIAFYGPAETMQHVGTSTDPTSNQHYWHYEYRENDEEEGAVWQAERTTGPETNTQYWHFIRVQTDQTEDVQACFCICELDPETSFQHWYIKFLLNDEFVRSEARVMISPANRTDLNMVLRAGDRARTNRTASRNAESEQPT